MLMMALLCSKPEMISKKSPRSSMTILPTSACRCMLEAALPNPKPKQCISQPLYLKPRILHDETPPDLTLSNRNNRIPFT